MSAALPGAKLRPILDAALAEVDAAADALSQHATTAGRAPASAAAERRLLHAVFLQLPVPVFLLGQDRTIRRANEAAARLLGSAPGYATGKSFTALVDLGDRARVQTQVANAFRTGQPRRLACSLLTADGLAEVELTACLAGLRADADQLIVAVTAVAPPAVAAPASARPATPSAPGRPVTGAARTSAAQASANPAAANPSRPRPGRHRPGRHRPRRHRTGRHRPRRHRR